MQIFQRLSLACGEAGPGKRVSSSNSDRVMREMTQTDTRVRGAGFEPISTKVAVGGVPESSGPEKENPQSEGSVRGGPEGTAHRPARISNALSMGFNPGSTTRRLVGSKETAPGPGKKVPSPGWDKLGRDFHRLSRKYAGTGELLGLDGSGRRARAGGGGRRAVLNCKYPSDCPSEPHSSYFGERGGGLSAQAARQKLFYQTRQFEFGSYESASPDTVGRAKIIIIRP